MSKITYKSIIKFPVSQRLFKGSDGLFYLADESADETPYYGNGRRAVIGKPDQTDDGPLAILMHEPMLAYYDDKGFHQGFRVAVESAREGSKRSFCNVCIDGALYLSAHLGLTIKTRISDKLFVAHSLHNFPKA